MKQALSFPQPFQTNNIDSWINFLEANKNIKHYCFKSPKFSSSISSVYLQKITISNIKTMSNHFFEFSQHFNDIAVVLSLSGSAAISIGGATITCGPNEYPMIYNENDYRYTVKSEPSNNLILTIPLDYLSEFILHYSEYLVPNAIFTNSPAASKFYLKLLKGTVIQIAQLANENTIISSQNILATAYEDVILKTLLLTLDSSATNLLQKKPKCTKSIIVKIAEEFIDENFGKSIRIKDLAKIANTNMRTLQATFIKIRGYSPSDFLKERRLIRARKILSDATLNKSILDVSLECGFSSHSRFSQAYKQRFGEYPSDTVKASQHKFYSLKMYEPDHDHND